MSMKATLYVAAPDADNGFDALEIENIDNLQVLNPQSYGGAGSFKHDSTRGSKTLLINGGAFHAIELVNG